MDNIAKLTPQEVRFWLDEAKKCEDRQKVDLFKRNNYPLLTLYYEGFERLDPNALFVNAQQSYSIINEYFPNTNAKISELMYKYPEIILSALKPDAEKDEGLMRAALQYLFNNTDALIETRVALFDMLYAGYCGLEIDHILDKGESIIQPPSEQPQEQGFVNKLIGKIRGQESQANEGIESEVESRLPAKEEAYGTNEKTYIRRISPMNLPLDWRAETLRDRRYNLKKVEYSQAEFNARYPEFKDKVNATDVSADWAKWDQRKHDKKIVLYEFQVKFKNNKYTNIVVSPQITTKEIDLWDRQYVTNGFNVKIGTLHKYGKLYPISFAQINKHMQDELNHYVRFLMDCAERSIPKYECKKDDLKIDGEEALRSTGVNDLVYSQSGNAVKPINPPQPAKENTQLLQIFTDQKQKLWGVSQSRLSGQSTADFATEMNIQEAGFMTSEADIQEGLRLVLKEVLGTGKDIIVNFWDGEYFLKVTGGQIPQWYIPQVVPNPMTGQPMVTNPLTDILTGDYEVDVDIMSSMRPNKEKQRKDLIEYLTWLLSPAVQAYLVSQSKTINMDDVKRTANMFGLKAETLFIDLQPQIPIDPATGQPMIPQGAPNAIV